jgi:hypothetical protein
LGESSWPTSPRYAFRQECLSAGGAAPARFGRHAPWEPADACGQRKRARIAAPFRAAADRAAVDPKSPRGKAGFCDLHRHAFCFSQSMIRKLPDGRYRLYSRKVDPSTKRRKNLGTFDTRKAAEKHERAVQFFKRGG